MKDVGAINVTYEQLPTAHDHTSGATDALLVAGFSKADIVAAPQARIDTKSAFNAANAALAKNLHLKHWVAYGLHDEAVFGAVRAAEVHGFKADNMIGVGIGDSNSALNEFKRPTPTGFFGTGIISPKLHGEETSELMYTWIVQGKEPPKLALTTGTLAAPENVGDVREKMGLAAR
jgi:L-arabinose transport system substrate-binding protein